jgi:hypothetical protein
MKALRNLRHLASHEAKYTWDILKLCTFQARSGGHIAVDSEAVIEPGCKAQLRLPEPATPILADASLIR